MCRGRTCSHCVVSSGSNARDDMLISFAWTGRTTGTLPPGRTGARIGAFGFRVRGPMDLNRALSVMIPAFNEERTLDVILKHVLERPEVGEVVAVDDGSTDGTWAIMSRHAERDQRVRAFRQESNHGKGAAVRRAIAEVRMP